MDSASSLYSRPINLNANIVPAAVYRHDSASRKSEPMRCQELATFAV